MKRFFLLILITVFPLTSCVNISTSSETVSSFANTSQQNSSLDSTSTTSTGTVASVSPNYRDLTFALWGWNRDEQTNKNFEVVAAYENGKPVFDPNATSSNIFDSKIFNQIPARIHPQTKISAYELVYPYIDFLANPVKTFSAAEQESIWENLPSGNTMMAFSGVANPFPTKVTHISFSFDNQPHNSEWDARLKQLLAKADSQNGEKDISDSPLIYKEAWYFDLDGDGNKEAVVRATNAVVLGTPATAENLPSKEKTGIYDVVLFTSKSLGTVDLYSVKYYLSKTKENDESATYCFYDFKPMEAALQYGTDSQLMLCPYYVADYSFSTDQCIPIVCDIDNDGKPELFSIYSSGAYPLASVHDIKDGKLFKVGFIWMRP